MDLFARILRDDEHDLWFDLVARAETGSVYSLPAYLAALGAATGGASALVGVFAGERLLGGVGLYFRPTRVGLISATRPLLAYQSPIIGRGVSDGPPARRESHQRRILTALATFLGTWRCDSLSLVTHPRLTDVRPFHAAGWEVKPRYTYLVSIHDLAATWQRLDHNVRRLIRRAEAAGLRCGEEEDFGRFYELHRRGRERKEGASAYLPEIAFRDFVSRLRQHDLATLYSARAADGRMLAAQLVLTGPNPITHTVCAVSDEDNLATGANPFLRWRVFEALAKRGYTGNDLTGAPYLHPVTRFKAQLGGELVIKWQMERPTTAYHRARRRIDSVRRALRAWVGRQGGAWVLGKLRDKP